MVRKMIKNLKFKRKKNSVYTVALERDENNRCKITKGKESIFVNCNPKVKLPLTLNLPKTYTGRWPPDPDVLDTLNFNVNKAGTTNLKTVHRSRQHISKNYKKAAIFSVPFIKLNSKH